MTPFLPAQEANQESSQNREKILAEKLVTWRKIVAEKINLGIKNGYGAIIIGNWYDIPITTEKIILAELHEAGYATDVEQVRGLGERLIIKWDK